MHSFILLSPRQFMVNSGEIMKANLNKMEMMDENQIDRKTESTPTLTLKKTRSG